MTQWRPIETAPLNELDGPAIYFIGGMIAEDGTLHVATCYANKYGAYEWWGGGMKPTHWMPLPDLIPCGPYHKHARQYPNSCIR